MVGNDFCVCKETPIVSSGGWSCDTEFEMNDSIGVFVATKQIEEVDRDWQI
jgi:hypothetical protein